MHNVQSAACLQTLHYVSFKHAGWYSCTKTLSAVLIEVRPSELPNLHWMSVKRAQNFPTILLRPFCSMKCPCVNHKKRHMHPAGEMMRATVHGVICWCAVGAEHYSNTDARGVRSPNTLSPWARSNEVLGINKN